MDLPETWPDEGRVQFVDYSVKYREELDNVIKNLNCDIKPKEKVIEQMKTYFNKI
jgi:ABC-type multidrug transport system fused ATPase/permease subunit